MILSILGAGLLFAGCEKVSSPHAKQAEPPTEFFFSAEHASNALAHATLFVEACTPRDSGTPGASHAANWLHDRLVENGVSAALDSFKDDSPRGPRTYVNVLASLSGSDDQWIVLLSHFDTKSGISDSFQGANDGASSTGLLLELAVLMNRVTPRRHNILLAFLDGEECDLGYSDRDGFHGSKHLAKALKKEGRKIKAVILMDMVGDRDLKLTVPRNSTPDLRVLALEAADATGDREKIGLFDGDIYDDHQAFLDRGFHALDLIDFDYGSSPGVNDYWHTTKDTIDKLSPNSLLATGRIVLEMVNRLSRPPSAQP